MTQHIARKRFGQNFLHDYNVIEQIIHSLNLQKGQNWVEIGPGQGALTQPLLTVLNKLDVVELDRDLVAMLQTKFHNQASLTIHSADALQFDFASLAPPSQSLSVVGNLPYNISTPLLFHLLKYANVIGQMYFMLQKEVVERLCAPVGCKDYGRLSIMVQYYCQTEHLFDVAPESFQPMPKVMSAIVKLSPYPTIAEPAHDIQVLNKVVTQAFSQRRKTLRNALKPLIPEPVLTGLGIDPTLRPENVSVSGYVRLSNWYRDRMS